MRSTNVPTRRPIVRYFVLALLFLVTLFYESFYMRNIVQTNLANLGTRILYTTAPYNSFDTHAGELFDPAGTAGLGRGVALALHQ